MKKLFMLAAVLFTALSCSDYDDSELRGRVDELEDKVESHEQWLAQLDASVKSLNDANRAFTALLNGGVITDVKFVTEGDRTGYEFTLTTGTTTTTYTVWNGDKGDKGAAPQIGVEQDSDGRYYWTLDGKPMTDENGNKVYASGQKGDTGAPGTPGAPGSTGPQGPQGATGAQGWTPRLKVEKDPAKEGTEDAETLYWWIGYDKNNDGQIKEEDGEKWEVLPVAAGSTTGTASGLDMEYDEENQQVTFTKNGVVVGTFDVYTAGGSNISVSFTVDGESVDEFGTINMANGETVEIEVSVEGASDNVVIKAEMQNPYGFDVLVDDMTISVEATESGKSNKLLVNVLDGAECYHTWIKLDSSVPSAEITGGGVHHIAYNIDGSYDVEYTIVLNLPAVDDLTFTFNHQNDKAPAIPSANITHPAPVKIAKGQKEGKTKLTVKRDGLTDGTKYNEDYYYVSVEGKAVLGYPFAQFTITDEPEQVTLAASNITNYFSTAGSGYLCDGNYGNASDTSYTQANFTTGSYASYMPTIAEWGIYIDINLPKPVYGVAFGYMHRSGSKTTAPTSSNGEIGAIRFGAKEGNEYKEIGTATTAADGLPCSGGTRNGVTLQKSTTGYWKSDNVYTLSSGASFSDVRFGVTRAYSATLSTSADEDGYVDATTMPWVSFCIAELEVFVLY